VLVVVVAGCLGLCVLLLAADLFAVLSGSGQVRLSGRL
jgi:hypothetical protein